jgi:hypothetical protein
MAAIFAFLRSERQAQSSMSRKDTSTPLEKLTATRTFQSVRSGSPFGARLACLPAMHPTQEEFTARVLRRGAFDNANDAEQAIDAVMNALGEYVGPEEAQALAAALPTALRHFVMGHLRRPESLPDGLYERVSIRENIPLSRAIERTQVVLQAMAEVLSETDLQRLMQHVGPNMCELFTPCVLPDDQTARAASQPSESGKGDTLATGQPGSRHPLSTARPETAHTHSVVRSDNPHADTKLSSTSGMTQERAHETLAEGRPGSKRPLNEGQ